MISRVCGGDHKAVRDMESAMRRLFSPPVGNLDLVAELGTQGALNGGCPGPLSGKSQTFRYEQLSPEEAESKMARLWGRPECYSREPIVISGAEEKREADS